MPSTVGNLNIASVQNGAVVQFGDAVKLTPSSAGKTYAGAGSFLTGAVVNTNNGISATNTSDPDVVDNKSVANEIGPAPGGAG